MKILTPEIEKFPYFTKFLELVENSNSEEMSKIEEEPKKGMKIPKLQLNPVCEEEGEEKEAKPKKVPKLLLESVIEKPGAPSSKSSLTERSSRRAKTSKNSNPTSKRKVFENPPLSERWGREAKGDRKKFKDDYETQWMKMSNIDDSIKQKILKKKGAIKNVAMSKTFRLK